MRPAGSVMRAPTTSLRPASWARAAKEASCPGLGTAPILSVSSAVFILGVPSGMAPCPPPTRIPHRQERRGWVSSGCSVLDRVAREDIMNRTVLIGLILVILGIGGLVIKSVTYQEDTASVDLGPVEITATEERTVDIPQVAAQAAIAVGALMVIIGLLARPDRTA